MGYLRHGTDNERVEVDDVDEKNSELHGGISETLRRTMNVEKDLKDDESVR